MIAKLFIPKLGMAMEKATIAEWCFRDGDKVEKDSAVLVIDTEKVANDIEAPITGRLVITAAVGAEIPCGGIVGFIAETEEEYAAARRENATAPAIAVTTTLAEAGGLPPEASPTDIPEPVHGARVKISPLAKKIAGQNRIAYAGLAGSGPGGRIVKRDIVAALESRGGSVVALEVTAKPLPVTSLPVALHEGKRVRQVVPLSGARKAISEHMQNSHSVSAPVTIFTEVDMTEMIGVRRRLLKKAATLGLRITFTDLFILAAAKVLKKVPQLNSSLIGNELFLWDDINIGFAVSVTSADGANSLVVPVIHDVDRMSLGEISGARSALVEKARSGKLARDEMSGGTFTITNTGTFIPMWHTQTPIINQPQAAILGTSGIVDRPVVRDGEIVVGPVMPLSLTFDHRIMDGEPPGQFLVHYHQMMLDPDLLVL